jgi:hypothetical protein
VEEENYNDDDEEYTPPSSVVVAKKKLPLAENKNVLVRHNVRTAGRGDGRGDGNIPGLSPLPYPSFPSALSTHHLGSTVIEPVCETITRPNRIIDNNRKRKRKHEYNNDELLLLDRMNVDSFDNVQDYQMSSLQGSFSSGERVCVCKL